jgi:hypothetical protein
MLIGVEMRNKYGTTNKAVAEDNVRKAAHLKRSKGDLITREVIEKAMKDFKKPIEIIS